MATTVTRYVNTASSGGDGTTNNTSGATAAYASLNAAIDAEERDLVSADEIAEFLCTGTTADTTTPTFGSGWVCDSTRYISIKANTGQEHGGKWNTGVYRLELTGSSGTTMSTLPTTNIFHCKFENIQINIFVNTGSSNVVVFNLASGAVSGARIDFRKCIFKYTHGTATCSIRFLNANDADWTIRAANCLFHNFDTDNGGVTGFISPSTNCPAYIFNCTFANNARALAVNSTTSVHVRNCLFSGNTTDITTQVATDSNYNATDKGSAVSNFGANSRLSQTFSFVDSGSGDYHLQSGDGGAKGFGEDLSGNGNLAVTDDIDGDSRSAPFDIGFDQFVASVAGTTYYILDSLTGDGWLDVQAGGSAPSDATGATGWTVSSTAADNYSQMAAGSERLAATFGGTALPGAGGPDNSLKDAIRLGPYSGDFEAGDWSVSVPVIAVDAGGTQDGAIRVRVWKSANANGSSATELTSGAVQLSTVTNLTTGAAQISSGTVSLGAITSGGTPYYLFFCVAWRITGQAS